MGINCLFSTNRPVIVFSLSNLHFTLQAWVAEIVRLNQFIVLQSLKIDMYFMSSLAVCFRLALQMHARRQAGRQPGTTVAVSGPQLLSKSILESRNHWSTTTATVTTTTTTTARRHSCKHKKTDINDLQKLVTSNQRTLDFLTVTLTFQQHTVFLFQLDLMRLITAVNDIPTTRRTFLVHFEGTIETF